MNSNILYDNLVNYLEIKKRGHEDTPVSKITLGTFTDLGDEGKNILAKASEKVFPGQNPILVTEYGKDVSVINDVSVEFEAPEARV